MNESLRKEIFLWMNQNAQKIKNLSIKNIADKFFTKPSTVTKALQSFGYKGYKEFKQVVFFEMFNKKKENSVVVRKITSIMENALTNSLFMNQMKILNTKIKEASHIYIIGQGHSALIAEYLKRQIIFSYANKDCKRINDLYETIRVKNRKALLIAISLDSTSKIINDFERKITCEKILIQKLNPKWKKVKTDNYKHIVKIPTINTMQDHYDNPVISKAIIEIAISIFLLNN